MRHSILSRALRPPSRINDETIETEFEKNERLLRARRDRAIATEENMRSLHLGNKPDPEAKLKLFVENKNCFEEQQHHISETQASERFYEEKLRQTILEREQSEIQRALAEKERKRLEARVIMDENKRLAEEKHKRQTVEREKDQLLDRENNAVQAAAFSQRRLR
jgi:hypothetical protein